MENNVPLSSNNDNYINLSLGTVHRNCNRDDNDRSRKRRIGNYTLKDKIGCGSFSLVYSVVHIPTAMNLAMKIIKKDDIGNPKLNFRREGEIMRMLNHPNIIKLYEIIESKTKYCLVMDLTKHGTMLSYIEKHPRMAETDATIFMRQLVSAVAYLHSHNIVHRDLKPDNLLLSKGKHIKLMDFGLSNFSQNDIGLSTFCGSPAYSAPEVLKNSSYIGPPIDCWSIGIILYVILASRLPFPETNLSRLYHDMMNVNVSFPDYFSEGVKRFIMTCLVVDSNKRPSIDVIAQHEWLNYSKYAFKGNDVPLFKPEHFRIMSKYGFEDQAVVKSSVSKHKCDTVDAHFQFIKLMLESYSDDEIDSNIHVVSSKKDVNYVERSPSGSIPISVSMIGLPGSVLPSPQISPYFNRVERHLPGSTSASQKINDGIGNVHLNTDDSKSEIRTPRYLSRDRIKTDGCKDNFNIEDRSGKCESTINLHIPSIL